MGKRHIFSILLGGLAVLTADGCISDRPIEPPKGKNADQLYKQGLSQLNQKNYRQAIETFYQLKYDYPSETAAMMADLKIADAYFANEEYVEAIESFEDFRKMHPASPYIPYVVYMLGLCHHNMMLSVDRDQTSTELALNEFRYLLTHFPNTPYAWDSRKKAEECMSRLSAHEVYVGNFYYKMKKYVSAIQRYETALKKYPSIPLDEKALFQLSDSYRRTERPRKAQKTWAALIEQYPDSKYAGKAREYMQEASAAAEVLDSSPNPDESSQQEDLASDSEAAVSSGVVSPRKGLQAEGETSGENSKLESDLDQDAGGARLGHQSSNLQMEDPVTDTAMEVPAERVATPPTSTTDGPPETRLSEDRPSSRSADSPTGLEDTVSEVLEQDAEESSEMPAAALGVDLEHEPELEPAASVEPARVSRRPASEESPPPPKKEKPVLSRDSPSGNEMGPHDSLVLEQDSVDDLPPIRHQSLPSSPEPETASNESEPLTEPSNSEDAADVEVGPAQTSTPSSDEHDDAVGFGQLNEDRPINITADRMDAFQRENRVIFEGNVVVRQEDTYIYAQRITADLASGDTGGGIRQVVASREVRITKGDRVALCDKAEFDHISRTIKLSGNPKIWQGSDRIDGEHVVVNLDEEKMTIFGSEQKRVSAVLYAKEGTGASKEKTSQEQEESRPSLTAPFAPAEQDEPSVDETGIEIAEGSPDLPEQQKPDDQDDHSSEMGPAVSKKEGESLAQAPPAEEAVAHLDREVDTDVMASEEAPTSLAQQDTGVSDPLLLEEEEAAKIAEAAIRETSEVSETAARKEPSMTRSPAEQTDPPLDESVETFVERWRSAWESEDLTAYMACYSNRFESAGRDWTAWRQYKAGLNRKYRAIEVEVEDVEVTPRQGGGVSVIFVQRYQADKYQDVGFKVLDLIEEEGRWKIIRENWRPLPSDTSGHRSHRGQPEESVEDTQAAFALLNGRKEVATQSCTRFPPRSC